MYYVIGDDGQKYGPADLATLQQWQAQGRLFPHTMLEDTSTGARIPASSVPGLFGGYQNPPNYNPPPAGYPRGYAANPTGIQSDADIQIRNAYIFAVLSFFCCPLLFGILGYLAADKALKMGHPNAQNVRTIVIVAAIAGMVFGGISMRSFR